METAIFKQGRSLIIVSLFLDYGLFSVAIAIFFDNDSLMISIAVPVVIADCDPNRANANTNVFCCCGKRHEDKSR